MNSNRIEHKIFSIKYDEKKLVYSSISDEESNLLEFTEYETIEKTSGTKEYDTEKRLVREFEFVNGNEATRIEYQYNSKGEVIDKKLFLSDSLFEHVTQQETATGTITKVFQYEELIERTITNKDGYTFRKEFFEENELVETQVGTYYPSEKKQHIEVMEKDGDLFLTKTYWLDDNDNVLKEQNTDAKGNLTLVHEIKYQNDLPIWEERKDLDSNYSYTGKLEYNKQGDVTFEEYRSLTGQLIRYWKSWYNNEGDLIEEKGFDIDNFKSNYGMQAGSEEFHLKHEYTKLKRD